MINASPETTNNWVGVTGEALLKYATCAPA